MNSTSNLVDDMKRSFIGILSFILTFVLGFGLASLRGPSQEIVSEPQPNECPPLVVTLPQEHVPETRQTTIPDFIPEFTDLTDFADVGLLDFKMKLVDIHEHENAYRKSEVIAKNGEQWLGLFQSNDKYYLRNKKVNVKFDPKYEGYGDEDYMRLTTTDPGNPVFILKNAKNLKAGQIESLYLRPTYDEIQRRRLYDKPLAIGYEEYFSLGETEFVLRVTRGLTKENERIVVLMLTVNGIRQAITYAPYSSDEDTVGHLVWVGDLDGDRKLDVYLDHSVSESCGYSSSLFLSSAAKKGELVRQVAAFGTAGC